MKALTCVERDAALLDVETGRPSDKWTVYSSLTDTLGHFGEPCIETTWGLGARRIQDVRHPAKDGGADVKPCEHYEWTDPTDD